MTNINMVLNNFLEENYNFQQKNAIRRLITYMDDINYEEYENTFEFLYQDESDFDKDSMVSEVLFRLTEHAVILLKRTGVILSNDYIEFIQPYKIFNILYFINIINDLPQTSKQTIEDILSTDEDNVTILFNVLKELGSAIELDEWFNSVNFVLDNTLEFIKTKIFEEDDSEELDNINTIPYVNKKAVIKFITGDEDKTIFNILNNILDDTSYISTITNRDVEKESKILAILQKEDELPDAILRLHILTIYVLYIILYEDHDALFITKVSSILDDKYQPHITNIFNFVNSSGLKDFILFYKGEEND